MNGKTAKNWDALGVRILQSLRACEECEDREARFEAHIGLEPRCFQRSGSERVMILLLHI